MPDASASSSAGSARDGLPNLIVDRSATGDIFTRAIPFLTLVLVVEIVNALDVDAGWANPLLALGGAVVLLGGFGLSMPLVSSRVTHSIAARNTSTCSGGEAPRWRRGCRPRTRSAAPSRVRSAVGGDGMDESTDPLARQLALSALTTEHFNLQTARMGTIAEANGRSTLYLGALSSAVIAIAFVGQANRLGDTFYLFALTLLPPVFLLGIFSYLRLVQTSIEDLVLAVGSFRIRQYFLGLDPAAVPFFPPTGPEGVKKLERIGVVTSSPLQMLLTAASMVACINGIVGGVTVALAVRSLLDAAVPVAAVTGAVVAVALVTFFFVFQVRRVRRAAAVVAELYEGQGPDMPGWSGRVDR